MSDPRTEKRERESRQVRACLACLGIEYLSLNPGSDPPDVIVHRHDMPPIDIEVTEYHPEPGRVAMQAEARKLRTIIDRSIEQRPDFTGLSVAFHFVGTRVPHPRYHSAISEETVRCVSHCIDHDRVGQKNLKLSFLDGSDLPPVRRLDSHWLLLPAKEWGILARHVKVLHLRDVQLDVHLPSRLLQVDGAWCSPYAEAFLAILSRKEEQVRRAVDAGKYRKGEGALWLLIVSDTTGDLSASIFGDVLLKDAIDGTGFDFQKSVFDEVWLTDDSRGGVAQCLFPWNPEIRGLNEGPRL